MATRFNANLLAPVWTLFHAGVHIVHGDMWVAHPGPVHSEAHEAELLGMLDTLVDPDPGPPEPPRKRRFVSLADDAFFEIDDDEAQPGNAPLCTEPLADDADDDDLGETQPGSPLFEDTLPAESPVVHFVSDSPALPDFVEDTLPAWPDFVEDTLPAESPAIPMSQRVHADVEPLHGFFYDVYTYLYVLKHDVVRLDPAFAVNWECSETIAIPQHPWKF